jgi:acetolactate synthase-1/2/3 large subunit
VTVQGSRTAAAALVDALVAEGIDRVFCVPGESYLAVLDALYDRQDTIETIACRHEGGAAMMAEADGKLTGRPGICMVTRGPGATNASAGLHVAFRDSTPLILFIGQVGREFLDRDAFQEVDHRRLLGQVTKWVAQVDDASRIREYVARAFAVAMAGRPGPVALALPEDMLTESVAPSEYRRTVPPEIYPEQAQIAALGEMLSAAERPLLILGGSRWNEDAWIALQHFAERNELPVAATFRRQDRFNNANPCYVGDLGIGANPELRRRVEDADLLMALGTLLGEAATSGYRTIDIPFPRQKLVHIHAGAEELGRLYRPDLAINATPVGFASMLTDLAPVQPRWSAWRREARAAYEKWQEPQPEPGDVQLAQVIVWLREHLPKDAILTNGAGNFAAWLHRYYRYRRLGTQLGPTSGSMGYGFPAAVAAKLRHPERTVMCVAGDGDFMMTGQELTTAIQYGAAVVVIVCDNGMYGTIRMHQERHFPGRPHATGLRNPDFVALAKACGAHAEKVERTEDFPAAFIRATEARIPALLHLMIDADAIAPGQSLAKIRSNALKAEDR